MTETLEEQVSRFRAKEHTYGIIRANGDTYEKTLVESGLSWDAAKKRQSELDTAERAAHPEKSTWTRDLFYVEMDRVK